MKKNGMTIMEFCVLTALAAVAFLAMEGYFRRGLQGSWRGNADSFSDEQYNPSDDEALDPGVSNETGWKLIQGDKVINIPPQNITIINPVFSAQVGLDQNAGPSFDLASGELPGGPVIQIQGWGKYADGAEHEDD